MKRLSLLSLLILCGCSTPSALSGLFTAKVSDKMQVAENVTGVESIKIADKVADKVADKMALVDTSKTSNTSVGGNQTNDSKLMEDYIEAMKSSHKELIDVMWKIIGLLIVQLVGIISAFGLYMWKTINFLLQADERRDVRAEKKEA